MRQLHQLARERTSAELVAGRMCQDLEVFQRRIDELLAGRAVLVEADRVLTEALVVHHAAGAGGDLSDVYDPFDPNSTEGGPV
ncbi:MULTISPECIES: hypothetical protein [unclassified Streptomyces]|uniref:hypothetical protein n=1 Tax=unclassified Streptomyces TaxID=2593676 RepID=UPI0036E50522